MEAEKRNHEHDTDVVVDENTGKYGYGYRKAYGLPSVILEILNDNKAILDKTLSGTERMELDRIRGHLEYGCTGEYRKPITRWNRFGLFYHVIFQLPSNHGPWRFKFTTSNAVKYRDRIHPIIDGLFGNNGESCIGTYLRAQSQCHDTRQSEMHFHLVLSKFLFFRKDKGYMGFFNSLSESDQPFHSLYLLNNILSMEVDELQSLIEEPWRQAIAEATGRKVARDHPPLIKVITREKQDEEDRLRMGKYAMNNALHTFRGMFVDPDAKRKGHVLLTYTERSDLKMKLKVSVSVTEFVRRYLLLPNKKLSIRWCTKGPFHHSTFHPILDAAMRLDYTAVPGMRVRLTDLEIEHIQRYATNFRKHYDANDQDGLERLRKQFGTRPSHT